MADQTTETAATPNAADSPSEAVVTNLLASGETAATTEQPGETVTEGTTSAATETVVTGAPEAYAFVAPEGQSYDSTVLDSFSAAAKEANLSQDAAQKLLEKMAPELASRQMARLDEQIKTTKETWATETRNDKDFGGANLEANLALAKKGLDFVAPKGADGAKAAFAKLLDDSGMGNNLVILQVLAKVGKTISDDTFVRGAANADVPKRMADVMYDKTGA